MTCQFYEKGFRCEEKATNAVYLRKERIGRVCDEHERRLTAAAPRRIKSKPMQQRQRTVTASALS